MIGPVDEHDLMPAHRSSGAQAAESAADDDDPLARHRKLKGRLRGVIGGVNRAGSS
jgi:hypothetical protein